MTTRSFQEYALSPLMLGAAQFGMPYGIANVTGQPDRRHVVEIVRAAIEGGVTGFDTAAAYGESEEALGQALRATGAAARAFVVTKVRPLQPDEVADAAKAARVIEESVDRSRCRLGLDCLPVVLFHREADAVHMDVLDRLRERGCLRYAGVSCAHAPAWACRLAAQKGVAALQLPVNLLDRRHLAGGALQAAAARGVAVFIRSVYLQGLLLMPEATIPPGLRDVTPVRRRLERLAAEAGLALGELALRYALTLTGATCVLVGVDSVAQLRANIAMCAKGPLDAETLQRIDAAVPELPERILSPALW